MAAGPVSDDAGTDSTSVTVLLISALFFCCLLTAYFLSRLIRAWALRQQLLDIPNHRSAHELPIPIGGGIAIVVTFVLAVGILMIVGRIDADLLRLILAPLTIALLGLIDDIRTLSARTRIFFHFAAAIWVVFFAGAFANVNLGGYIIELKWLGSVIGVFYLVWLLNLFNFMDGVDGIAASEAVCVSGSMCLFLLLRDTQDSIWVLLALAGGCSGFLLINWPPAKLFMGDVGSGFLGILLGTISIMTINQGLVSLWVWLIVLGFFIVDASLTLFNRLLRGDRVHEAHDLHAYQHATRSLGSKVVLLGVIAINIFWLFPLAWLANAKEDLGLLLFVLAYVPLAMLCWVGGSGQLNAKLFKVSTD